MTNELKIFEMTCEYKHLEILINSLSDYICSQFCGLDAEVVDVPKTTENIKIASDMQLVLKHHLGGVQHAPKQTAETTGLIWCKEVILPEETNELEEISKQGSTGEAYIRTRQEIRDHAAKLAQRLLSKKCDNLQYVTYVDEYDENLQYTNEVLQQAWDNVKERHKDILQRISDT